MRETVARRVFWGCLLAAGLMNARASAGDLPASPAAGKTALAVSPAGDREGSKGIDAGMKAANAGQWDKARQAFLEAWKLNPHPQIAANLGHAEWMAGRYRDAAEHLRYFLREAPAKVSAAAREKGQRMLAEAQAKIGMVAIEVDVEGADVMVDGAVLGRSPILEPVFVESGKRIFEAKRQGYKTVQVPFDVAAGSTPKVTLHLVKEEPPTVQTAQLPVTPASTQPAVNATQPASSAQPAVSSTGSVLPSVKHEPSAAEAASSAASGSPESTGAPRWKPWAIGGGAALAAVGLGVGIGFTVASNSKAREVRDLRSELTLDTSNDEAICAGGSPSQNKGKCDVLTNALQNRDAYRSGAIVGYALGSAAAVGTVVLAVWPKKAIPSTAIHITPILSWAQGGMVVNGAF